MDEKTRAPAVDGARLEELTRILQLYKAGKANLERRVVAAENWWKLRNAAEERRESTLSDGGFRSKSGWLHNVIVSKHADAMDAFPEPVILPREPDDDAEAAMLGSIIPVVLAQNRFEDVYSDALWQKLKTGTGVYKVVWDASRLHGLGDVAICAVDLLNLFWEPGVTDIQDSRYFFHTALEDNEQLEERWPQLRGALRGSGIPEFWAAGERRTSHRNALLSWRAAEDVLRAGPDAVVGPAIDRLREDEEKREKAATPAAGMTFSHVSDWLESDVVAPRDHASFVRAAVAVERYRRANGGVLPPTLDALVPDYLPAVPRAARTGEPLVYEPGPIEIPAETLHVLADSDAAAARSADEFEDCFDDVGPETRTLPPVVLPGFRLVLPSRNEDPEDKRPVDFLFSPAQGAAE